jgi:serine/threonine protein kinase
LIWYKAATGTALGRTGTVIGSAEYVAPEQGRGKAVFASDLYSLGVTYLHLLTGLSPFDLYDIANGGWAWRDVVRQPVSEGLGEILDRLIAPPTNQRYGSAREALRNVRSLRHNRIQLSEGLGEILSQLMAIPANSRYGNAGEALKDIENLHQKRIQHSWEAESKPLSFREKLITTSILAFISMCFINAIISSSATPTRLMSPNLLSEEIRGSGPFGRPLENPDRSNENPFQNWK